MSESEQDVRMGARLDETRKAIEALQQQLDNSQGILQANPQLVFTQVFPSLRGSPVDYRVQGTGGPVRFHLNIRLPWTRW